MGFFNRLFGKKPAPSSSDALWQAMWKFVQTSSDYSQCQRVVEQYPELLSADAESLLERMAQENPRARQSIVRYRVLLHHLRAGLSISPEELFKIVRRFVEAPTPAESRRYLERHPVLLSDPADECLQRVIQQQRNPDAVQFLEAHRILLQRCRKIGIQTAFREFESPEAIPVPAEFQNELTVVLRAEQDYQSSQDTRALEDLIEAWGQIVHSPNFPLQDLDFRLSAFNDYATAYGRRYRALGNIGDLAKALQYAQDVVRLAPSDAADLPIYLTNLGTFQREKFARTGDLRDLESAIQFSEQAIVKAASDVLEMSAYLNNLGAGLNLYYIMTGDLASLERAIQTFRRSVAQAQADDLNQPRCLTNLGLGLICRYDHTAELADLEAAIRVHELAVNMTPTNSQDLPRRLNNLSIALERHYNREGNLIDLNRAISIAEQAVVRTPHDMTEAVKFLGTLANLLKMQFVKTGNSADLVRAIQVIQQAVDKTPPGSPSWAGGLLILADCLRYRFASSNAETDRERAIQLYEQSAKAGLNTAVNDGLWSAVAWGIWALERRRWDEAVRAYHYALEASERLLKIQAIRGHKESWLRKIRGMHANAAYAFAREENLPGAVVALEQGRARLLADALERNRLDLKRLQEIGKSNLYQKYVAAARRITQLENTDLDIQNVPANFDLIAELRAARAEIDAVIEDIHQIPDYQDFFLVPSFDQIQRSLTTPFFGVGGLVAGVYLAVTQVGGVALIVHTGGVKPVWLDFTTNDLDNWLVKTKGEEIVGGYLAGQLGEANLDEALDDVLPRIGKEVMQSVASALDDILPRPETGQDPRLVILIPTGRLMLLPLHAATYQVNGQTRAFLDDFAVVYTSSARALNHSCKAVSSLPSSLPSLFAVANPLPLREKAHSLTFARAEVDEIIPLFAGGSTALYETKATQDAVKARLGTTTHIHFSCHGQFDPATPLDSGLILCNGAMLTLRDLLAHPPFSLARLAVLSACQTAITDFNQLPDEAVGLPAGFVQAGVPGVIGTLWPVNDLSTALLMIKFYEYHLRGDPKTDEGPLPPHQALHRAQHWLRQVTNRELATYFDQHYQTLSSTYYHILQRMLVETMLAGVTRFSLLAADPDACPFAHPYYWAPFIFVGA